MLEAEVLQCQRLRCFSAGGGGAAVQEVAVGRRWVAGRDFGCGWLLIEQYVWEGNCNPPHGNRQLFGSVAHRVMDLEQCCLGAVLFGVRIPLK